MECVIRLAKSRGDLGDVSGDIFYLATSKVYATLVEPERLSFFYDKLELCANNSRSKYPRLFRFLDNLGNVVATNNGNFMKFLSPEAVANNFVEKYPELLNKQQNEKIFRSLNNSADLNYCTLSTPALDSFLMNLQDDWTGVCEVLAVGFTRKSDSTELWDFADSFVVYERSGELEIFYADSMDTRSSILAETFSLFKTASAESDFEKMVNFLSI
nr:P24 protein [Blackberry dwarf-associated virus]